MRENLLANCADCFGLCCVALPFSASADFAFDKDAGDPCRHLQPDFRCGIHASLRRRGFPGCTVYDCFGAGQQVSRVTFDGHDWRESPGTAAQMFKVFPVMRQLHELLWYLDEARGLESNADRHSGVVDLLEETHRLTGLSPDGILAVDVPDHRRRVDVVLHRTSESVRSTVESGKVPGPAGARQRKKAGRGEDLARADLIGADLSGADLRGADLRGAYLIGADLRGADLRLADLIGADLRAAKIQGADLSSSLFLTQFQANAANGDRDTRIPPALTRPGHWSSNAPG